MAFKVYKSGSDVKKIQRIVLLPGSPLYFLKNQREKLASYFIFGDYDSSLWHITLGNKRLSEAEELLMYNNLKMSLKYARKSQEEIKLAIKFWRRSSQRGEEVNYLKEEIRKNLERQKDDVEIVKKSSPAAVVDFEETLLELNQEFEIP
jgi:hypothetical protein